MVQIHQVSLFFSCVYMRSFRKKVLVSYIVVLGLFFALMFPLVMNSVHTIVVRSMNHQARAIIEKLQKAQSDKELVSILKDEKHQLFYRVGIINYQKELLYDSHTKNMHTRTHSEGNNKPLSHGEVDEAFRTGKGYSEADSPTLGQKLIYIAKRFTFQGNPYVLRIAFPYDYMHGLKTHITTGFFLYGTIVLLLFALLTAIILNHLSAPIRTITKAISTYKEGHPETLPQISLNAHPKDEFALLAKTVTSLSHQIKKEIQTITDERNERDSLLESIQAGIIVLDNTQTIIYINSTGSRMLGVSTKDCLPSSLSLDLHPLLEKAHSLESPLVYDKEFKQGRETVYLNISIIPKTATQGTLLVLHDRSQDYKMLEMRKAFIANASHELKTPITIIRGFAETLFDNPTLPQQTIHDVTKKIVDSCHKMTGLIRNLLLLSDIEHLPSYRLVEVNFLEVLTSCFTTMKESWPSLTIQVECSEKELPLFAAKELLEMAFMNLFDNAAKYCETDPQCRICIQKREEHIHIQMSDNGIGIPQEDLPHLFQRFFRGSKAGMKKYSGYGLGLSIVDTIIKKHKGTIHVQSELGKGTSYTIVLPNNLHVT